MPYVTSVVAWIWVFAFTVVLATIFLGVLPMGAVVQVLAHGALLIGGAAMVLGLRPR